jgi:hypothetical protein
MKRSVFLICCAAMLTLSGCYKYDAEAIQKQADQAKLSDAQREKSSAISGGRDIQETVNKMDGKKSFTLLMLPSDGAGAMIARCSSAVKLDVYIDFDKFVESDDGRSAVRVKFNDAQPLRQTWGESSDHNALFSPNPASLLAEIKRSDKFMIEHKRFHGGAEVTEFDTRSFREGIDKLSGACKLSL